jgi:hypothetical protein
MAETTRPGVESVQFTPLVEMADCLTFDGVQIRLFATIDWPDSQPSVVRNNVEKVDVMHSVGRPCWD